MADLNAIRSALAGQLANLTGVRALAQAPDQITPPVAIVLPGNPLISYADDFSGSVSIGLSVMVVVSDASPSDASQRALDSLLGIGAGQAGSVPWAIAQDPSLGGAVQWAQPLQVSQYGRINWANVDYWGARLAVTVGAI